MAGASGGEGSAEAGELEMGKGERDLYEPDDHPFDENGDQMTIWHSNKYALESSCEFCDGLVVHASWCIEKNRNVLEAYKAVFDGVDKGDEARLAGLGVRWK